MKVLIGAVAALLFAAVCWPQPASAQGVPRGSYLRSCGGVYMDGDTLIATCRRADGYEQQTALRGVHRCVGDIGNRNGHLTCSRGGEPGPPPPGYGGPAYGSPGYGGAPYGSPGYGGAPYGSPGYR